MRRDFTRLHAGIYARTHAHNPPALEDLEAAEHIYLGGDLVPAWLWAARSGGALVALASLRLRRPTSLAPDVPGAAELGWFGVLAGLGEALERAVLLAVLGRAFAAGQRAGMSEVHAELGSVDPLAKFLLHALPFRPGKIWLTFVCPAAQHEQTSALKDR